MLSFMKKSISCTSDKILMEEVRRNAEIKNLVLNRVFWYGYFDGSVKRCDCFLNAGEFVVSFSE
ncbi:hypothetical protein T05_11369 [Trichinella murrelli]|uniref:Uncharacterized protein n=1 Tax=Trichinella murrelli TaxID=144512 RepID=A0A0V0TXC5_9BILA|nr:hypothetical protein T05_11369 [Trichinella murrelli]